MADSNIDRSQRAPFPIQGRVIRFVDQDGTPFIDLDDVRADIENANVIWRHAGFRFSILSDETRSSDRYRVIGSFAEFLDLEQEEWSPTNRWINVYYGNMVFAAGVCSFPHPREAHAIAMHFDRRNSTRAHEFGHYFDIEHTFSDSLSDTDSDGTGDPRNVMSYDRG